MKRPPARSLLGESSDLYEFYVRLEWAACEREGELDDLSGDQLERFVWEASQLHRVAVSFLGCCQALEKKPWGPSLPISIFPRESDAAFFSAYLDQQASFWSSRARASDEFAREAAIRLSVIADASATFHKLIGQPPDIVRERAWELYLDDQERCDGWLRWDSKRGLEVREPNGPRTAGDKPLLDRLRISGRQLPKGEW